MLFGFSKKSISNLNNPVFYYLSCFANTVTLSFAYFTVPRFGTVLGVVGDSILLILIVEFALRRKELTEKQYTLRYVVKVILGTAAVSCGVLMIDKDYVLYLPILVGMMYFNVNTILKSAVVQYTTILFMCIPFIKLIIMNPVNLTEYISVISVFLGISILSTMLFRTNKEKLEEAEKTSSMVIGVHKLMTGLALHDIRNTLQKMQILATAKYRNDIQLFMTTMYRDMKAIEQCVENNMFSQSEEVNIVDIVDSLSHITNNNSVLFCFVCEDQEPVFGVRNMIYSALKNFIENSIEATQRQHKISTITVAKSDNKVIITDNCGGFDVSAITKGVSAKVPGSKKHGIFLRTITDPAIRNLFGFTANIERIEDGTKITMIFDKERKYVKDIS